MYDVIIEEQAALEIEEIYNWYENKLPGIGERFKQDLDNRINILYKHPQSFSFITSFHRRVPLQKFPYFIICRIFEKTVVILSVIYSGRIFKRKYFYIK